MKLDQQAFAEAFPVPEHIRDIAGAVSFDLNYGPVYTRKPDLGWQAFDPDNVAHWPQELEGEGEVVPIYSGEPGDLLREFITELPSEYFADEDGYPIGDKEPEGEWLNSETMEPCDSEDEGAEYFEPDTYYRLDQRDIKKALFGGTIAHHFN